jgi:aryl-alcohol dehydrogenase-like predicted oxidoreductase
LQTDCIDVVQLHTWTRAWNRNPTPLEHMRQFQKEGKLRAIGISTPNMIRTRSSTDARRMARFRPGDLQHLRTRTRREFLPVAKEHNVGVIVRVPFDESALTGKFTPATKVRRGRLPQQLFRRRPR